MVSPSRCPPWQPERPGPTRREPRRAQRSYTTRRDTIAGLSEQLSNGPLEERRGILHAIIQRIDLTPTSIVSILHKTALARLLDLPYPDDRSCVSIRVPVRLRRRGVATKTIVDSPDAGTCNVDPDLCRLIAQAHLSRIPQMDCQFDDLLGRFCYKNQCNTIIATGQTRLTLRVTQESSLCGSISTAA